MLAAVLLGAVVAVSGVDGAAPPPAGAPIVEITIVSYDVFDLSQPKSKAWPYRWANALHVVTAKSFIRSMLLFKVGDPLDYELLAETERLLRERGFMNPVDIAVRPAPGGAQVLIETHDQWTTEVGFNYGRLGQRSRTGVSISEENLFGWGKRLTLDLDRKVERTTTTLAYRDPLLLGTRWRLDVAHSNASDGSGDKVRIQYPFYSLGTERAGGFEWQHESHTQWLWSEGHKALSGTKSTRGARAWGGVRLPSVSGQTNRLTLGLFHERATYKRWSWRDGAPYQSPTDLEVAGPEIGWERQTDRWRVVQGFRGWQRQEDVALGPNWRVLAGFSHPVFGGDRKRLLLGGDLTVGRLDGAQYSWLNVNAEGRVDSGLTNAVLHIDAGTARTGPTGWRARVAMDLGRELDRDRQLALGADVGLRGWDPGYFDGTSRAVVNVEWRHRLTGELLNLGILGLSVFADAGRSWGARVGRSTEGFRSDAGVGLHLELTRSSLVRAVRLELALPDDGRGPVFLATSTSLF
jgi:hypothetical protein